MSLINKFFIVCSVFYVSISWTLTDGRRYEPANERSDSTRTEPLISDTTTMQTAWDLIKNPLTDSLMNDPPLNEQIKWGYELFVDTPHRAKQISGNKMTCAHCHLNAGQRLKALPLVGVSGMYPEYNKRAGRVFNIEDRIVECFNRSMNASKNLKNADELTTQSKEVLAIAAYISWLSKGYEAKQHVHWRGLNVIPADKLIPVEKLNPKLGKRLYNEKCTNCHGKDGQGVAIGDKKAGPLWGQGSWNDGAGAARVYTLAGMIRYMMPYLAPGSLTDEEAQQIAAYITSRERPEYPYKNADYQKEKLPPDAVYYRKNR